MVKYRGTINIFKDYEGSKMIDVRFYDYEYILSSNALLNEVNEHLMVYIDTSFNNITGKDSK
jgi:hypothetical protein